MMHTDANGHTYEATTLNDLIAEAKSGALDHKHDKAIDSFDCIKCKQISLARRADRLNSGIDYHCCNKKW